MGMRWGDIFWVAATLRLHKHDIEIDRHGVSGGEDWKGRSAYAEKMDEAAAHCCTLSCA